MNYPKELIRRYYSTHYKDIIPQTLEGWNWALERIELNFGDIFSLMSKNSAILDVGCGVGYLEDYLLKKGFTKIDALDFSEEQIQIARQKLKKYHPEFYKKVQFIVADAFEYLSKIRNSYDLIAMIDFIEHLSKGKIIKILKLSFNTLSKGGFLILRTINGDNPIFPSFFYRDFTHETPLTSASLKQCLNITGFEIVRISYELMPREKSFSKKFKQFTRELIFRIIEKLFGVPYKGFAKDLVAVARKK